MEPTFQIGEVGIIQPMEGKGYCSPGLVGLEVTITSIRGTHDLLVMKCLDGYTFDSALGKGLVSHTALKRKRPKEEPGSWEELRSIWNPLKLGSKEPA